MNTMFPSDEAAAAGMIGVFLVFILVVALLSLLPTIFYLVTLQKALSRCQTHNRAMDPGLVWLMLIPFFNIIWHFFVVINLSDSLEREFIERGLQSEPAPGRSLGLAVCILNVCSIIPYLGVLSGLAGFVCWIIYWVKIADFSSRLFCSAPGSMTELPSAG